MEKTIKIYDKIGSQGRSRINANKLHLEELANDDSVVLDFKGVDFLSRSFTDEIISQLGKHKYELLNANDIITNMFRAVVNGRSRPRVHKDNGAVVLHFDNMVDLSRYLNSRG